MEKSREIKTKYIKCKLCEKDVPSCNMDLDYYIWECYDCQDKHEDSAENYFKSN